MTTLNARASHVYAGLLTAEDLVDGTAAFDSIPDAFEEGWELGYKAAQAEVAKQISEEIQMYDQEWSANTWRSIASRIAREAGGLS